MREQRQRGITYFEVLATASIIAILASAVMPLAKVSVKRQREVELRRSLRVLRTAIDKYKEHVDAGLIGGTDVELGSEGYPESLDVLVEGVSQVGELDKKLKFLRRIEIDPVTGSAEWQLRCYQDRPDSTSWCGRNVYDVRSASKARALDGTRYEDW